MSHFIACASVSLFENGKVSTVSLQVCSEQDVRNSRLSLGAFLVSVCQDQSKTAEVAQGRRLAVGRRERRTDMGAGGGAGTGIQSGSEPGKRLKGGTSFTAVEGDS